MPNDTLERVGTDIDLEQLLTEVLPCDWQAGHRATGTPCTEVATHLCWADCTPDVRWHVCDPGARWLDMMAHHECRKRHTCLFCNRLLRDCWKVVPI